MIEWGPWLLSGAALLGLAVLTWLLSLKLKDVSIVDSLWSLMFLACACAYWLMVDAGPRAPWLLLLVALWAVRLSAYISWRNHGHGEDRRYQEIRANNQPGFAFKSLYIVFGLQALLAWIIALPLAAAISGRGALGWLDLAGLVLWAIGWFYESVGDWQLARFKAQPESKGRVMQSGLWRNTRHPNYFGNFLLWWGFYLIALSAGAWWTIISPLLMSFLLLKVSGVALLEKDIGERRPKYAAYIAQTNAFFPGPRKN